MILATEDAAFERRAPGRWLIGSAIMSLSFVALMVSAEKLELSDSYIDSMLTDEMYRDEVEWRPPPANEGGWRAGDQFQKQESRIHFGYDSAYEELRARDNDSGQIRSFEHERSRPNTLLRIDF